ncbi:MAG: MlaD family protein [Candidatus Aureabacteria bacterium]|nr:MlaD family protein [Candidatus Auribacterota bacterium]
MATRAEKIKVGIFLLCGAVLLAGVFALFAVRRRTPSTLHYVKFQESVRGLNKDSNVLYQGVPVGKVEKIGVTKENEVIVTISLDQRRVTLREGTVATLNISSLMGGAQVELSGGDPGGPLLSPDSLIPSRPSIIANIASSLPQILSDIRNLMEKLDRSLGDIKAEQLGKIVGEVDETVVAAKEALREIGAFLRTTRGSVLNTEYEISRTMQAVRGTAETAGRASQLLEEDPAAFFWGRSRPEQPYAR